MGKGERREEGELVLLAGRVDVSGVVLLSLFGGVAVGLAALLLLLLVHFFFPFLLAGLTGAGVDTALVAIALTAGH